MSFKSNNKVNLAVIGCGNIARFHIPAMRDVGFNIVAIAGSLDSKNALNFAKKYKINKVYNNPIDMVENVSEWDALLILSPVSTVIDYLNLAAPFGKPILSEKPVAYDHEHLKDLIQYKNIRVAYNRRFYSGVEFSKKYVQKHPNSLIKVTIPESRKDPSHNINFPNRLPLLSYENSVHMFDLINYISEGVEWKETSSIKTHDKYIAINALGHGVNGATIQLDSYFNSPDNFSINILFGDERIEMKPIELTSLFKGMEVNEATIEIPIRTYTPKLQKKIIDSPNGSHKPGFLGQAQDFMNFFLGMEDCPGADIMDAYSALKLAQSLVK
jgi:predicted dehydrogenase